MVVVIRAIVPASELALHNVLTSFPDAEFEVERIVVSGEDALMPLLWVRNVDVEALDAAIESDSSVSEVELLAEYDNEYLYRMIWVTSVHLLMDVLTNTEATVLDANGRDEQWYLRILYPDRELLSRTHEFCEEHGLTFDIQSIRDLEGEPAGRYGLTEGQYEALVTAVQRDFYAVPRGVSLEELADELDVSHQALSEQLRRGTEALIEDALMIGPP